MTLTDARNQGQSRRIVRLFSLLAGLFCATSLCGCNYFIMAGWLIGGPPSIEPDFDLSTKKSLTAKDVTVAVVCLAPLDVRTRFTKVNEDVARYVAHRLKEKKIRVINPDLVFDWLDKNQEWDRPEEIGEAFDVTYVIYIDLYKYNLYEEHSPTLYRGRAEAMVSVIEMDDNGDGEKIYSKEVTSIYPLSMPRETSEVPYGQFRRQYLSRLSEDIGRLFYEYYNGDDIPDAI